MIKDWKGIPRAEIPWHPAVDESKCNGCKKCFEFCSHGGYDFDAARKKTRVARPGECVVGCSSCRGLCETEAISFPPLSVLTDLLKARGLV